MHRIGWTVLAALVIAGPAAADESDVAAIEEVVTRAYVEGIQKKQDPEKFRSGFHPDFVMVVNTDEGIVKVTRDAWIARIEEGKKKEPDRARPEVRHEFSSVEVAGDTAVARVELYRGGKHAFTEYLSLYRFANGWQIIGKIFQAHR